MKISMWIDCVAILTVVLLGLRMMYQWLYVRPLDMITPFDVFVVIAIPLTFFVVYIRNR